MHVFSAAAILPTLKRGDRGPAVKLAQQSLISAGYRGPYVTKTTRTAYLTADGIFGEITELAVIKFNADKLSRSANVLDHAARSVLPPIPEEAVTAIEAEMPGAAAEPAMPIGAIVAAIGAGLILFALLGRKRPAMAGYRKRRRRLGQMPGERVELHPGTDLWTRGAKYGTIRKSKGGYVWVKMDNPRVRRLVKLPVDRVTVV